MNKEQLEHLLDVMRQMETAAINENWSLLQELDLNRSSFLLSITPNPEPETAELQAITQQLLELDRHILSVVQSSHKSIAKSPKPPKKRQHAVLQYQHYSHLGFGGK